MLFFFLSSHAPPPLLPVFLVLVKDNFLPPAQEKNPGLGLDKNHLLNSNSSTNVLQILSVPSPFTSSTNYSPAHPLQGSQGPQHVSPALLKSSPERPPPGFCSHLLTSILKTKARGILLKGKSDDKVPLKTSTGFPCTSRKA